MDFLRNFFSLLENYLENLRIFNFSLEIERKNDFFSFLFFAFRPVNLDLLGFANTKACSLFLFCFFNALQCLRHWRKFWNVSEIEIFISRKFLNFCLEPKMFKFLINLSNCLVFYALFRIQWIFIRIFLTML